MPLDVYSTVCGQLASHDNAHFIAIS